MVKGYHYLNFYNYFMGLRITNNRVKLEKNKFHTEIGNTTVRESNYNDNPNRKFSDIETTPFGRNKLEYQSDGGYKDTGGYIFYFNSNLTYDEVDGNYTQLVKDGLFDDHWLSIVLEMMFYNGNYQTGVILSYEFLITNAGKIFKDKSIDSFYMSRYSPNYKGYSTEIKNFLIFLDVVFALHFIINCFRYLMKMTRRLYKLIILRHNFFKFVDILDWLNLSLIFINIVFFSLVVWFPPAIQLPTNTIEDFKKYRQLADRTTYFTIVASIATITILTRCLLFIAKCYPAFRILIISLKASAKDSIKFFIVIFILMLGFIYFSEIMFNCYIPTYKGFFQSLSYAIFNFNENPDLRDLSNRVPYKMMYSFFYILFIFWFSFMFAKLFASIIIVRWMYMKSEIHFENEVKAKVIDRKNKRIRDAYISILRCKKYEGLNEKNQRNSTENSQSNSGINAWK